MTLRMRIIPSSRKQSLGTLNYINKAQLQGCFNTVCQNLWRKEARPVFHDPCDFRGQRSAFSNCQNITMS